MPRFHYITAQCHQLIGMLACACVALTLLPGCALFHGGNAPGDVQRDPGTGTVEQQLHHTARAHVERLQHNDADRVVRRDPYYFKEYAEFPQGLNSIDAATIQERESRTAPYIADVVVPKVRYFTPPRRDRDDARSDTVFDRQTGREVITFEYRNGAWRHVGALFVVETTEHLLDGQWVQRETAPRVGARPSEEDERSFWRRMWDTVAGP